MTPLSADRLPVPFERCAEGAGGADRTPQQAARQAVLHHQLPLPGRFEVAAVLGVGLLHEHLQALVRGHPYLLMMSELVIAGVPHPMFMANSTSLTCRQPPSR